MFDSGSGTKFQDFFVFVLVRNLPASPLVPDLPRCFFAGNTLDEAIDKAERVNITIPALTLRRIDAATKEAGEPVLAIRSQGAGSLVQIRNIRQRVKP